MTLLGRLNRVLRIFGIVLARIQVARPQGFETVDFRWMTIKEFKRLGGHFR